MTQTSKQLYQTQRQARTSPAERRTELTQNQQQAREQQKAVSLSLEEPSKSARPSLHERVARQTLPSAPSPARPPVQIGTPLDMNVARANLAQARHQAREQEVARNTEPSTTTTAPQASPDAPQTPDTSPEQTGTVGNKEESKKKRELRETIIEYFSQSSGSMLSAIDASTAGASLLITAFPYAFTLGRWNVQLIWGSGIAKEDHPYIAPLKYRGLLKVLTMVDPKANGLKGLVLAMDFALVLMALILFSMMTLALLVSISPLIFAGYFWGSILSNFF